MLLVADALHGGGGPLQGGGDVVGDHGLAAALLPAVLVDPLLGADLPATFTRSPVVTDCATCPASAPHALILRRSRCLWLDDDEDEEVENVGGTRGLAA